MYLLLHRALRNAGDFLILERARRLFQWARPGAAVSEGKAWIPLAKQFSERELARFKAVIICGGPGFQPDLYPRLYPLAELESMPPIVLLALGSSVLPGTDRQMRDFHFAPTTHRFLSRIVASGVPLGTRDALTAGLVRQAGFQEILMTGDPVWYDLDAMAAPIRRPESIASIAFTPPANPAYFAQALELLKALERDRPGTKVRIVHHRGVQLPFQSLARRKGWESTDITGSATGFATYDEVDIHVGYRVHAHLYCLSHGIPSYLVAEDSRGRGVHATLGELGALGFDPAGSDRTTLLAALRLLPRLANAHRPVTAGLGARLSALLGLPQVTRIVSSLRTDEGLGFPGHERARETIRATLPAMRRMIDSIP